MTAGEMLLFEQAGMIGDFQKDSISYFQGTGMPRQSEETRVATTAWFQKN